LDTDASGYALGGIIQQIHLDKEGRPHLHLVAFHSCSLTPAEKNYDIYDCEMLTIISMLKAYRYLLWGAKCIIRYNHKNLEYYKVPQQSNARQLRWKALLAVWLPRGMMEECMSIPHLP
jgi:hypothetical protein